MKKLIGKNIGNYVFDSNLKTITISGLNIDKNILKSIVNKTTNQIIHNKDKNETHYHGKSYTLVNNIITFETDNSKMSNSDELLIEVDIDFSEYKLLDIVNKFTKLKNIFDINYSTEIMSGVSLQKEHDFTNDGFLNITRYYKDYIDENDKGTLIVQVEEIYTTNPNHNTLNKSAREVISRVKKRKYVKADGTLDETTFKETSKQYKDRQKKNKEGTRRRENLVDAMSENVATAGIITGVFLDENDAFNNLSSLLELHSAKYQTWIKTGRGNLLTDLQADNTTWLNNVIIDNTTTQSLVPQMIGMSYKSYIIEKLKGNLK